MLRSVSSSAWSISFAVVRLCFEFVCSSRCPFLHSTHIHACMHAADREGRAKSAIQDGCLAQDRANATRTPKRTQRAGAEEEEETAQRYVTHGREEDTQMSKTYAPQRKKATTRPISSPKEETGKGKGKLSERRQSNRKKKEQRKTEKQRLEETEGKEASDEGRGKDRQRRRINVPEISHSDRKHLPVPEYRHEHTHTHTHTPV